MKASLILVALALCAVSAVYGSSLQSDNKMGRCRRVTGMGLCIEHCQRDSECDGMDKCCSNGCGRSCQTPTFADEDEDDEVEGECPLNEVIGICAIDMTRNNCGFEGKCEPGFKCCAQGCNKECVRV